MNKHTFAFADMAGFTALTESHGDEHAADAAFDFFDELARVLPPRTSEVVKTVGDAALIRFDHVDEAVESCQSLLNSTDRGHGTLSIRIGLHRGAAVKRSDDWFGSAINHAARIASIARGGEILASESVHGQLSSSQAVGWHDRGTASFKNISDPVRLFGWTSKSFEGGELLLDPVCHMRIAPALAATSLEYDGETFFFCSDRCATTFAQRMSPDNNIAPGRPPQSWQVENQKSSD